MPTENRSSNTEMVSVPFVREDRYIVIKRSDLMKVPVNYRSALVDPMLSLLSHLPRRECLVIESDWPEYQPTWSAIEARVTGKPAGQHQGEPVALPRRQDEDCFSEKLRDKAEGWNACLDEIAKLGPLYPRADTGEVERLRVELPAVKFNLDKTDKGLLAADAEVRKLRAELEDEKKRHTEALQLSRRRWCHANRLQAQLAERDALLRELADAPPAAMEFRLQQKVKAALSASAEPNASLNQPQMSDYSQRKLQVYQESLNQPDDEKKL